MHRKNVDYLKHSTGTVVELEDGEIYVIDGHGLRFGLEGLDGYYIGRRGLTTRTFLEDEVASVKVGDLSEQRHHDALKCLESRLLHLEQEQEGILKNKGELQRELDRLSSELTNVVNELDGIEESVKYLERSS